MQRAGRLGLSLWRPTETSDEAVPACPLLSLLHRPVGRWLLISAFLAGLCLFSGAFPYLCAFVIQEFSLSLGAAGLLVAGFGLESFAYTRAARHLVRHLGERRLLLLGGTGLAAGVAGLAWAPTWPVVATLQISLGLMFCMFHGVLQARVTEAMPEARGSAVSAVPLARFLGQSAGFLALGGTLAVVGYRSGFTAASTLILAAALCSWRALAPSPHPKWPSLDQASAEATTWRKAGSTVAANQGLRRSHPVVRQDGWGSGK